MFPKNAIPKSVIGLHSQLISCQRCGFRQNLEELNIGSAFIHSGNKSNIWVLLSVRDDFKFLEGFYGFEPPIAYYEKKALDLEHQPSRIVAHTHHLIYTLSFFSFFDRATILLKCPKCNYFIQIYTTMGTNYLWNDGAERIIPGNIIIRRYG